MARSTIDLDQSPRPKRGGPPLAPAEKPHPPMYVSDLHTFAVGGSDDVLVCDIKDEVGYSCRVLRVENNGATTIFFQLIHPSGGKSNPKSIAANATPFTITTFDGVVFDIVHVWSSAAGGIASVAAAPGW